MIPLRLGRGERREELGKERRHARLQVRDFEWLREERFHANRGELHPFYVLEDIARRHHDGDATLLDDVGCDLIAAPIRHGAIHDHEIGILAHCKLHSLLAVVCGDDGAGRRKRATDDVAVELLVVDHEDARLPQEFADFLEKRLQIERLREESVEAVERRIIGWGGDPDRRHHDDRDVACFWRLADRTRDRDAICSRHGVVQNRQPGTQIAGKSDCFCSDARAEHAVALLRQPILQQY